VGGRAGIMEMEEARPRMDRLIHSPTTGTPVAASIFTPPQSNTTPFDIYPASPSLPARFCIHLCALTDGGATLDDETAAGAGARLVSQLPAGAGGLVGEVGTGSRRGSRRGEGVAGAPACGARGSRVRGGGRRGRGLGSQVQHERAAEHVREA
jgi:hypothetical protein